MGPYRYSAENRFYHIVICLATMIMCVKSGLVPKDNMDAISFIGGFLKLQRRVAPPAIVTAFLCWESGDIHKLTRFLSKDYVLTSVHSTTEKHVLVQYQRQQRDVYKTFILDLECEDATNILAEANDRNMLRRQHRWLLINQSFYSNNYISGSSDNYATEHDAMSSNVEYEIGKDLSYCSECITLFEKMNILLDSDITMAIKLSDELFHFYEVYRRGPSEKVIISEVGHQGNTSEIFFSASLLPAKRRLNLHLATLRVGTVFTRNDTIEHLEDGVDIHIDSLSKSCWARFKHAAIVINAKVQNVFVDSWGDYRNGSWTGLTGYLERNEIDLGTTPIFLLDGRMNVLNYIHAPHAGSPFFLFRKPPLSVMRNIFILPFSSSVWTASAALLVLTAILLYGIFQWEAQNNHTARNDDDPDTRTETTDKKLSLTLWSDVILISIGQVCQQGSEREAQQPTGRIISFLLYISVMFLYTAYSACIIALLQSTSDSIHTLKDLYDSGMELGVWDNPYNRYYFPRVNDPVREAIYRDRIHPKKNFMPLEDGIARVKNGLFAFHASEIGYRIISETYLEEEKCGLEIIPFFDFFYPHVGVSKETQFKEVLSFAYRRMQETGFQIRIHTQYYSKRPKCDGSGSFYVSVGIKDCLAVILVLIYGIPCSIGVLLLEIMYKKLKQRDILQMTTEWDNKKSFF